MSSRTTKRKSSKIDRLYFLTNRYNLLTIMSSGLLASSAAYQKYYADLLELCPGRVPLWRAPIHPSLLDLVRRENPETAFPVLVELDSAGLELTVAPSIGARSKTGNSVVGASDYVGWAAPAIIPRSSITAVHFMDDWTLSEVTARSYENVQLDWLEFKVSPDLVSESGIPAEAVVPWLQGCVPVEIPAWEAFQLEDRLTGALALSSNVGNIEIELEALIRLLPCTPQYFADEDAAALFLPPWLRQPLKKHKTAASIGNHDMDACLFRCASDVFQQTDLLTAWRPLQALQNIRDCTTASNLSQQNQKTLSVYLQGIEEIIRADRDFEGFKPGGLEVPKALLLVLLRPEPHRLLRWSEDEPTVDRIVMFTAALLSGLLTGRTNLPIELRAKKLDDRLSELSASALAATVGDVCVRRKVQETSQSTPRKSQLELSLGQETQGDMVDRVLKSDLTTSPFLGVAIEICRTLKWHDCIQTVVVAPDDQPFKIAQRQRRKRVLAVEIMGIAEVEYELDEQRFRSRLTEEHGPTIGQLLNKLLPS